MEKIFQSQWHGIKFNSFSKLSQKKLAGSDFYAKFYKIFHKKFKSYNDLDSLWVKEKIDCINILKKSKKFDKNAEILSIGCGIGIIEKELITKYNFSNIEVTEVATDPLKWLFKYLSEDKIHIGFFPDCMPKKKTYDLIYLSGIEYVFNDEDLIKFLVSVNKSLKSSGECILLSASHVKSGLLYNIRRMLSRLKNSIVYSNQLQFWGYARNSNELTKIITESGFRIIKDGRDDKVLPGVYWSIFSKNTFL